MVFKVGFNYHCIVICEELLGFRFNPTVLQVKPRINIINKADNYDQTNPLFLNSHAMKFNDLVYYKIIEMEFRAIKITRWCTKGL